MTKLLVVGAGGQVGRSLLALNGVGGLELVGLTRGGLDITDLDQVRAAVAAAPYAAVINAAAYTSVDKAESEETAAYAVNRDGAANLAAETAERDIPLLHISTDYVFDGTQARARRETDPTGPTGVYGASKLAGEEALKAANPQHLILRTAWVYGPWTGNFVATMVRLAAERQELRVVADQRGGPTPAFAIAKALLTMAGKLEGEPWGVYHFSGAPAVTWHGFAEAIIARAGPQLRQLPTVTPVGTANYPTPALRPANSELNCTKIERQFGIRQPDWQETLGTIVETLQLSHKV